MYEYLKLWAELKTDRRAVTALEYGLIAGLIAVALITGAASLGTHLNSTFAGVATRLNY